MTSLPIDSRVQAFATAQFVERPGSRVNVACAHDLFLRSAEACGRAMPLATFGAELASYASRAGGGRDGDCVTGLVWRENARPLASER